ncbi:MAG TPA: alpha-L-rhamnosidase C-terminal domain-containing protein [Bacteroidales bacterium]|nr:alpha-L-rhamnosidase C-terminal domain-containing protein [Bacteroidales bacterium]
MDKWGKIKYKLFKTIGLLLLILTVLSCKTDQDKNRPEGLMIEFIREPGYVPIMDLKPEFSWIVPQSANVQSAYQILVASSVEKLEKNIPDIWDSKKICSNKSVEIEFGAPDLINNSALCWKVRIWDENDKPSEYSAIQSFTTGIPKKYTTTANKFQSQLIEPSKFLRISDDHYFVDFGKDAFATLILEFTPEKIDTITVHLGEKTIGSNKIDPSPGGSIRYQKILLPVNPGTTKYILNLPKNARNTGPAAIHLPDSFGVITPFRYCELENCSFNLKSDNIRQKVFWHFFDDNLSSFICNDTILNSIWNICKYSMKATSFAGIYVDGDRERIPYEADAYINQLGHYYTDREYSLARLTNEYFIKHPTWPTEWILHTVPMFYYDYMYTGNIESVSHYYEELKHKTLISLSREDGLISSKNCTAEIMKNLGFSDANKRLEDIVDWPPSQKDTSWKLTTVEGERDGYEMVEINTVVNAFHYNGLKYMSYLAGQLGMKGDSVFYQHQAMKVKGSINEKLLSKTTGIYLDGESSQHSSLHANMMALAFNLVPEENMKPVINFIKSRGMACSVYGAQYLLEGLYEAGESDYAFDLITATHDRSWWNMIKSGTTISMEAWDIKYKPNSDWNHAWGAAPANIIPRYMWGIRPIEPGWAKAIIKPQLSILKQSKVSVPTIRGNIHAEFIDDGQSKEYTINIPGNMECDFVLSDVRDFAMYLNNQKIDADMEKLQLEPGLNIIKIKK